MKRIILISALALMVNACHSSKQTMSEVLPEPIVLNNSDSVRVETIIKTEYVPVRVDVPVPQQSVSNIVEADTSHIETDVALSNAWIRPDGTLYHDLLNKDIKLSGEAYVPQTTTENNNEAIKTKEIPVPQPYPVYVEKSLSKSEQFKLSAFWYLVAITLITGAYIFRKPFMKLLRKIIG